MVDNLQKNDSSVKRGPEDASFVVDEENGPWRTVSREQVYANPWIEVYHEAVKTPGGTDGIYGLVHFRSRAVGVVPLDDDGGIYLVRQHRYTLKASSLDSSYLVS